jgi:hypothetical protein
VFFSPDPLFHPLWHPPHRDGPLFIDSARVKLTIGEDSQIVYKPKRNGEAFGWSSLGSHGICPAPAQCVQPTKLLRTDSKKLLTVLNDDAANAAIFFKRLAATLGNRLLESYKVNSPDN